MRKRERAQTATLLPNSNTQPNIPFDSEDAPCPLNLPQWPDDTQSGLGGYGHERLIGTARDYRSWRCGGSTHGPPIQHGTRRQHDRSIVGNALTPAPRALIRHGRRTVLC
jgi:hypothetical protein